MPKKTDVLPKKLYCDASYLIAFFATEDQYHQKAIAIRKSLTKYSLKLFTSWSALSEAITLLLYHYGYSHALALKKSIHAFEILLPNDREYNRAFELFERFNKDQEFSLNDLLTYAMLEDRLKQVSILTFDRDFIKMGVETYF